VDLNQTWQANCDVCKLFSKDDRRSVPAYLWQSVLQHWKDECLEDEIENTKKKKKRKKRK